MRRRCVLRFQVTLDADEYLEFPDSGSEMTISAGLPNLAGNHRRTVRVEVKRNDLYRSVTAIVIHGLIPLGSKPAVARRQRFERRHVLGHRTLGWLGVHGGARSTGGNSYAELLSGTEVRIEYEITSMRAMTVKGGTYLDSQAGWKTAGKFGINMGYTAEASVESIKWDTKHGGKGETVVDGPNFKVESTIVNSWDIVMTTDRARAQQSGPGASRKSRRRHPRWWYRACVQTARYSRFEPPER